MSIPADLSCLSYGICWPELQQFVISIRRKITLLYHLSRVILPQHLLDNGQSVGPVDSTMQLLLVSNKSYFPHALGRFRIFREIMKWNKVSNQHSIGSR
jgi:hypothetical protein